MKRALLSFTACAVALPLAGAAIQDDDTRVGLIRQLVLPPDTRVALTSAQKQMIIGVHVADVSEALASQLDIEPGRAILIEKVVDDLPAQAAGMQRHDIIIGINGKTVTSRSSLSKALSGLTADDEVVLTLLRRGKRLDLTVGVVEDQRDEQSYTLTKLLEQTYRQLEGEHTDLAKDRYVLQKNALEMLEQAKAAEAAELSKKVSETTERVAALKRKVELIGIEKEMQKRVELERSVALQLDHLAQARARIADQSEQVIAELQARLAASQARLGSLDEKQKQEVMTAYERAIQDVGSAMKRVERRLAVPYVRVVEGEDGRKDLLLLVAPPAAARLPRAVAGATAPPSKETEQRLRGIEERLARIEHLLQQLIGDPK